MHETRLANATVPLVLTCALVACSGSGEGLDENGRPLDDPAAPLTAEFAAIQARIFDVHCIGCHAGAAAPLGLRLTEGTSYAALVDAPSVEQPALQRVQPGDPARSYLVQKISGTASVGARMPLGAPPLPAEAIDAIRQWILDGAAPPRASARVTEAAALSTVFPMHATRVDFEAEGLAQPMTGAVSIASSVELDASSLAEGGIELVRSGGDGEFASGNEIRVTPLQIKPRGAAPAAPTVIAITPLAPWSPDRYRLTIRGSGPLPVRDRAGRDIDGDGDSVPGGDLVVVFDVGPREAAR